MKVIQNFTKENLWNEIKEKYPDSFEHFSKWIDEYKKAVGWETLFGGDLVASPKFHDLPVEMQIGILSRYQFETWTLTVDKSEKVFQNAVSVYQNDLSQLFQNYQATIQINKINTNDKKG